MKRCNKCRQEKPLTDFQRKSSAPDGYARMCRRCDSAIRIQRRIDQGKRLPDPPAGMKRCGICAAIKPLSEFYARKSGPQEGKPYAHCIPCVKARNITRARTKGVPPRSDPDPDAALRRKLAANYNMTLEDFNAMLAAQDEKCLGCGIHANEVDTRFHVDHDHSCCPSSVSCGKCVRGLLCRGCNFAIGHVRDNPKTLERLATYLYAFALS